MNHSLARQMRTSRQGLTLIEVILMLLTLLTLVALVLPATRSARGAARRVQCANNLKQLSLAATNFAAGNGGALPLYSAPGPGLVSDIKVLWAIQLGPYMDRAGDYDYIIEKQDRQTARDALHEVLGNSCPGLMCPEDNATFKQRGGLSYGANIGFGPWQSVRRQSGWTSSADALKTSYDFGAVDHSAVSTDWNDNGKLDAEDKEFARATGVFWPSDADGFQMTTEAITKGDGSSQTVMFAESLNLSRLHEAGPARDGREPTALNGGVGLGYFALGLAKRNQPCLAIDRASKPSAEYLGAFAPSSRRSNVRPYVPAASSLHTGGVGVAYCDGHVSFAPSYIDPAVWAALHTPRGQKYGEMELKDSDY